MGRGEQKQVNTNAQNLYDTTTGQLPLVNPASGYSSLLANPGYSVGDKTAITGATEGGVGAAFGSETEGAANRSARTNNAAGLAGTQDALARQRMITSGNLAAQNETKFADAARQDRNTALAGQGGLYSANLGGANAALGTQAHNAAQPGFWDQFIFNAQKGASEAAAGGAFG